MRFTNNPYEGFMKEKSYFKGVPPSLPPKTDPDRKSGNPQAGVKMVCQL